MCAFFLDTLFHCYTFSLTDVISIKISGSCTSTVCVCNIRCETQNLIHAKACILPLIYTFVPYTGYLHAYTYKITLLCEG